MCSELVHNHQEDGAPHYYRLLCQLKESITVTIPEKIVAFCLHDLRPKGLVAAIVKICFLPFVIKFPVYSLLSFSNLLKAPELNFWGDGIDVQGELIV